MDQAIKHKSFSLGKMKKLGHYFKANNFRLTQNFHFLWLKVQI